MNFFSIDNLENYFIDALTEIMSKMAGLSIKVISSEDNNSFDAITGAMILPGEKSGMLFLSAKEDTIQYICSCMTGTSKDKVSTKDTEDTMRELVNMTAGSAKQRLNKSNIIFNLSTPFLFKGENMCILNNEKTRVFSSTLGNEEIAIGIKIAYL